MNREPAGLARAAAEAPLFPPRLGLVAAVAAISWAAILVRWSSAPPLVVGAYRLAFAALLFWAIGAVARVPLLADWESKRLGSGLAAAACLAAHFGLWNASLGLTSVASSVLLVSTQPVFVAVLGRLFLKERVAPRAALGVALALGGALLITGGDLSFGPRAWRGDLLALGGAVSLAVYYLLVRRLRAVVGLLPLMALLTPLAAALLLGAALFARDPIAGYPPRVYGIFFLLALGPTVVGHTLLNWALRYMKAYEVNVAVLGEPVGATVLALLLFGENPPVHVLGGGALVLGGIGLAWSVAAGRGA